MTATVAAPAVGVANDQTAAQPGVGHPSALVPAFGGPTIHAAPYTNVNANQNAAEPVSGGAHALIVSSTHSVIPAPFFGAILGAGGGQVGYAT